MLLIAFFVGYFPELAGVIGTTAIIASVVFLVISFGIGYVLGGPSGNTKRVLAVGTAPRNLSAATAVAAVNFTDPDVLVMVLVVGIGGVVVLMRGAGETGDVLQIRSLASGVGFE